tara:strand:- start:4 stop:207 length:204 start_codon:yes stop_codon:yes gene_type:complete
MLGPAILLVLSAPAAAIQVAFEPELPGLIGEVEELISRVRDAPRKIVQNPCTEVSLLVPPPASPLVG